MCRTDERTHKHHIIPRYMGGTDEPENLVEVTITQHTMFHFCNYQLWRNEEDRLAWRGLSGLITPDEATLESIALGRSKSGNKHKENKTGVCGRSPEKMSEDGKKGGKISGNKCKENKTGIFGLSPEKRFEANKKGGKIAGNKCKENKTGVCGRSPEKMSEDGKKGGKSAHEKGVGIHGLSKEEKSQNSKKAVKVTNSQKWQCTVTGYISTPGPLTCYQKKKGIDTSKRIRIQ